MNRLTGLDTPAQEGLLDLLDTLREQKVTVMVATHDLEQAAKHFDRIMLLNKKIVAFGNADRMFCTLIIYCHAYGGRFRTVEGRDDLLAVDDSCCDEGEHDHVH